MLVGSLWSTSGDGRNGTNQSNMVYPMTSWKFPWGPTSNGLAPGVDSRIANVRVSVAAKAVPGGEKEEGRS